jgi:hypothetical protein
MRQAMAMNAAHASFTFCGFSAQNTLPVFVGLWV